ncbi:MAG TPA: PilZ domain-containing protein [Candidatus Solibacter sp.]|nr:PilZ domain-containing protein [Candidatus Solibacter sp.]
MESPAGKGPMPMRILIMCSDASFLESTQNVLIELKLVPKIVGRCDVALSLIRREDFDVIMVDWWRIENFRDFFYTIHTSELNADCVLIAVVGDLSEMPQAHSARVHFVIHKGSTEEQIAHCLRAAYGATLQRRRKLHREPVNIMAAMRTRIQSDAECMLINLSEAGAGLRLQAGKDGVSAYVGAGDQIDLRFALPGTDDILQLRCTVVWSSATHCGVHFRSIPDGALLALERWLTACVERSMEERSMEERSMKDGRVSQSAISA